MLDAEENKFLRSIEKDGPYMSPNKRRFMNIINKLKQQNANLIKALVATEKDKKDGTN